MSIKKFFIPEGWTYFADRRVYINDKTGETLEEDKLTDWGGRSTRPVSWDQLYGAKKSSDVDRHEIEKENRELKRKLEEVNETIKILIDGGVLKSSQVKLLKEIIK